MKKLLAILAIISVLMPSVTLAQFTVFQGGTGVNTIPNGLVRGNGTADISTITTSAGISGLLSDETGSGALVFGTLPTFLGLLTGNGATGAGFLRWLEDTDNGSNYIELIAPTAITSNIQCVLENDSSPIPDSCVGNGSDAVGLPAGSDGQVQYNDGGIFGALPNLYTPNSGSSINAVDNNFFFVDNGNDTKQVRFEVSGVTAGQTSELTVPDADGTLVLNDNTATLSGKSIDSDNNTLSVDPDELKATDSPADEECYTYESTGTTGEWQTCGAGGATAYDDIGDPDDNTFIDFTNNTNTWSSDISAGDFFSISNGVGDLTADTTLVTLGFRDNGDVNGIFLDLVDDLSGTPNSVFSIGADGVVSSDAGATFASTVSTPTLTLTGTGTLNGLDAIDGTTETTLEGALDIAGDVASTGMSTTVIQADAVALGTDTTGNYVSSATASGGLTLTGTEGGSLGVLLPAATDALSATTSSGSGLQLISAGLTLLQGCSDGQILKWTEATDLWGCAADGGGGGSFDSTTVDNTTWSDGANASNTWTFDVSGTDTTWAMGNNNWIFGTGSVDLGSAGVRLSHDGDGAITFLGLGNGSDEDLTLNLDDTSNTGVFTSSTSLATLNFSGISLQSSGVAIPTISSTDTLTNKTIAAASNVLDACVPVAVTDEYSNLTTGTAKATFRMPFAMTVTSVRASLVTAATGGTLVTVDINEAGTSIISTKITIDASEKTSTTAATAAVISDSSIADDAEMTVDIDAVGSTTPGNGLKIQLCGTI